MTNIGTTLHGPTTYGQRIARDYGDTGRLQYLREFTKNSEQAILATPAGHGQIRWDVAANVSKLPWSDLSEALGAKLMIVDNGSGFDPNTMANTLTVMDESVGRVQGMTGNYGVGGKISALKRNPFGVVYITFRGDRAFITRLRYFSEINDYGIDQIIDPDTGEGSDIGSIDAEYAKETWLSHLSSGFPLEEHGTIVIFLGENARHNTTAAPADSTGGGNNWVAFYLNRRWSSFAEGTTVKVSNFSETTPQARRITGQRAVLDKDTEWCIEHELPGARLTIWCLKESKERVEETSSHLSVGCQVATVQDGEIYDWVRGGGASQRLKKFGVTDGFGRIAIHIEPYDERDAEKFRPNKTRTRLMMSSDAGNEVDLPWDDWCYELINDMPPKLAAYIEASKLSRTKDKSESVKEVLSSVLDLIEFKPKRRLSRSDDHYFNPNPAGPHGVDTLDHYGNKPRHGFGDERGAVVNPGEVHQPGGATGDPNQRASEDGGDDPARKVHLYKPDKPSKQRGIQEPDFVRVSIDRQHPLREQPRMSHQDDHMAAEFTESLREGEVGTVYLNVDWPDFNEMVAHCCRAAGWRQPTMQQKKTAWYAIEYQIRIKLTMAILKTLSYRETRNSWGNEEMDRALCPASLTFLCSDMWHACDAAIDELKGKKQKAA